MHTWGRQWPRLERCIPIRVIDVDRAHLDAVLAHIAYDLGRSVETHGLRIEERRREHVRITAFEPGRGIDQKRKARGVAFRKSVFAKPFDLAEAALGEFARIIPGHHAFDHFSPEGCDRAGALESRHGAAEPVRLARREAAG